MNLRDMIDTILNKDFLDSDECEESKCQEIEKLIFIFGWEAIQECMINIMLDNKRRIIDYEVTAQVFWGACLDNRNVCTNKVIALLYYRLQKNKNNDENNLVWSIVTKLKKIDYLSDYNPLKDDEIIQEQIKLGIV